MKSRWFIKIFASYFFLAVLMGGALDLFLTPLAREHISRAIEESMLEKAKALSLMSPAEIKERLKELGRNSHQRITLVAADGTVMADSEANPKEMDNHFYRSEIQEARLKGKGKAIRYSATLKENFLYIAVPLRHEGKITGYVRIARSMGDLREAMEKINRQIHFSILAALAPAFLISLLFTFYIVSPWRKVVSLTNQLQEGEEPSTVALETGSDLEKIIGTLNEKVKEVYEKLREERNRIALLTASLSAVEEGVIIIDEENRILSANTPSVDIVNKKPQEIEGKTLLEVFHNAPINNLAETFWKTEKEVKGEISLKENWDAKIFHISVSPAGKTGGRKLATMVMRDISALKKLESMRRDFLASVTHELKTPLTAIMGYAETLLDLKKESAEEKKFLEIIYRQANRLNRLVDDLIFLSDLEQGTLQMEFREIPVNAPLEEVFSLISRRLLEKNLYFQMHIPSPAPVIWGDHDRIVQALLNIMDNAVKYTEKGGIAVEVIPEGDDNVIISVKDTGIGIPPIHLSRLGERFYRVDKARSREMGGTGLGLSIVRHIMRNHGGNMEISSTLGEGTTVKLKFKIREKNRG